MIKKIYSLLPGPPALRVIELIVMAAVALIALGFLFEWAGDLLDSGGVIGEPPG